MKNSERINIGFHDHERDNIPIIAWEKPNNAGIIEALNSPFVFQIAKFEKVKVANEWTLYLILTLYTDEQIRRGTIPTFFHLVFPTYAFNTEIKSWIEALRSQTELVLFVEYKNTSRLFPIFDYFKLKRFLNEIDFVAKNWTGENKFQEINKLIIPIVNRKVKEFSSKLSAKFELEENINDSLIKTVSEIICVNIKEDKFLFEMASQSSLIALKKYLEDWASRLSPDSINEILSTNGETKTEEICRTWFFCHKCIELSQKRSDKSIMIAIGLNESGTWWLHNPFGYSTLEASWLLSHSDTYRYLLNHRWKYLINNKDVPLDSTGILKFHNLGEIPKRKQFDEVKRILTLAALEQKYSIEQLNIIEVCKQGCERIEFFPIKKGGLKCLFKVVVDSSPFASNCLFGEIDAAVGYIHIFAPPRSYLMAEKQFQLIMFIVSAAFRDLVVARDRIGVSKKDRQNNSPRSRGSRQENFLSKIRWIPRYKSEIDKSFADPNQMLKRLKNIAPQMRVAHTRILPENHKASEQAQIFASEYDWILPDGVTFVRATNLIEAPDTENSENIRAHFRSLSLLELLFDV